MIELSKTELDKLSVKLKLAVEDWSVSEYADGFRTHLGASIIGRDCDRYLFLTFRWVKKGVEDGRMLRLFERGKREEQVYVDMLRKMGFRVEDLDPSTGKQWRVKFCHGHFGGSSDGKFWLPESWGITEPFIPEFKTNQTGATFNKLGSSGVEKAKVDHFIQHSIYGYGQGIQYGAYFNTNKNDDDMYIEFVKLDFELAQRYIKRAENIIMTDYVPAKISEKETDYRCRACHFHGVCHKNQKAEKNCRSCEFSKPAEDGYWNCQKYGETIPKEFIPQGCDSYKAIV